MDARSSRSTPAQSSRESRSDARASRDQSRRDADPTRLGAKALPTGRAVSPTLSKPPSRFSKALMIPSLAEAVDAAIASYAGQARKSSRQAKRRSIDERLKRLADVCELWDLSK